MADIDHACVLGDSNFRCQSVFSEQLRALGEPYVLETETSGLRVEPEDADVLEPSPTNKRGPPRQYLTVPEDIDPEPPAAIADGLDEDD